MSGNLVINESTDNAEATGSRNAEYDDMTMTFDLPTMTAIDDKTLNRFCISRVFRQNRAPVNHIDFSPDGELLVTSSYDDQLLLYNCVTGTHMLSRNSKKYGVNHASFTHAPNTVLFSSTKLNHDLRFFSLHDNKFIRYFSGHTEMVTGLARSPSDDYFLSASEDKTVRFWDLKSPNCVGMMATSSGRSQIAFDPEGIIFAVGMDSEVVKLYDARSYEKGPFTSFLLPVDTSSEWTSIAFSQNGEQILINTNSPVVQLVDAFQGSLIWKFTNRENAIKEKRKCHLEACFSPDSNYILSAESNGKIYVWKIKDGKMVAVLNAVQSSALECMKFNPKLMMMASASLETALWLPELEDNVSF